MGVLEPSKKREAHGSQTTTVTAAPTIATNNHNNIQEENIMEKQLSRLSMTPYRAY